MSREYNKFVLANMQPDKIKRMIAWDARQDRCSRWEQDIFNLAVDNGFALKNHKERSDFEREILNEDLL